MSNSYEPTIGSTSNNLSSSQSTPSNDTSLENNRLVIHVILAQTLHGPSAVEFESNPAWSTIFLAAVYAVTANYSVSELVVDSVTDVAYSVEIDRKLSTALQGTSQLFCIMIAYSMNVEVIIDDRSQSIDIPSLSSAVAKNVVTSVNISVISGTFLSHLNIELMASNISGTANVTVDAVKLMHFDYFSPAHQPSLMPCNRIVAPTTTPGVIGSPTTMSRASSSPTITRNAIAKTEHQGINYVIVIICGCVAVFILLVIAWMWYRVRNISFQRRKIYSLDFDNI